MRLLPPLLALCLCSPALAAPPVLRPYPLSAACQKAGYSALQDAQGTVRVLRYVRLIPDNTQRLSQYYAADGRLQSVRASASGFAGRLYDLTARASADGTLRPEQGYRSKLFSKPLGSVLKDVQAIKAGRC